MFGGSSETYSGQSTQSGSPDVPTPCHPCGCNLAAMKRPNSETTVSPTVGESKVFEPDESEV